MFHRRKEEDQWINFVPQLVGFALLLALVFPQFRHVVLAFGFIAVCFLGVVVAVLIGFGLYRWLSASAEQANPNDNLLPAPDKTTLPTENTPSLKSASLTVVPQTTTELLEQLRSIDWFQFEKLMALMYRKFGYMVDRRGGANPDGGIDLVIQKNSQVTAVQCKQWKTWNVGVKTVREFIGALTDANIQKGVLITLSGYTAEARQLAEKHGIEIINEARLAQMLEATDVRFDPETLAILRDTRKYCPKCESEMVLRTATKGMGTGKQFWGCSQYPRCRYTMPK